MTGYLGTAARMVPVVPTSAQSEDRPERFTIMATTSKRWAFDTARNGVMPRAWSVDLGLLDTREMGVLDEFVQGAWGAGPFRWISCAAHDTNVLTPAQSILAGLDAGTGMNLVDGYAPRSVVGPGRVTLAESVPVVPGLPVTVSVDVSGVATLTVVFRDGSGAVIDTRVQPSLEMFEQRLTYTAPSVPVTVRTVDVQVSGHTRAGRPQVTWTAEARPWAPGRGADQVVIQSGATDPVVINRSGGYWSGSMSLIEVG